MKSNYKKLGTYIREVDIRNDADIKENLLGVSTQKIFIPSIANTIGTDFTKYKVVKRNQFAYVPDTSRRGDKIGMALLQDFDTAIVSQAYTVFEIIDTKELLPEYLMMWFRRPEFDRYARYMSHGSVREIFGWDELCGVELPVPDITEQQNIVDEYNVLSNRIALNEQMNQKLDETAQAIYKQWFVDFEFPDENGQPYKSSGGEFEESELGDIPKGWRLSSIKDFCFDMKTGGTPSRDNMEYWSKNDIPWIKTGEVKNNVILTAEEYISEQGLKDSSAKIFPADTVIMALYGATAGQVGYLKFETSTNQACCAMMCSNKNSAAYLFYHLMINQKSISNLANGGAQPNLSKSIIEDLQILIPRETILSISPLCKIINHKYRLTNDKILLDSALNLLFCKLSINKG